MPTEIITKTYRTADNQVFSCEKDAIKHEFGCDLAGLLVKKFDYKLTGEGKQVASFLAQMVGSQEFTTWTEKIRRFNKSEAERVRKARQESPY